MAWARSSRQPKQKMQTTIVRKSAAAQSRGLKMITEEFKDVGTQSYISHTGPHEVAKRVLQRVTPYIALASGQTKDVHNHHQFPCPHPDVRPVSSSWPGPGSSASMSPDTKKKLAEFDVFLNHRGPDLKRTFVSHLDAALRRVGRNPFLDAKSLVKGQHALNSIDEALTGVVVHVAIFSPRYAESKYCLNELCDMLASGKPLIPVFYNVDPENLRWPENEKGPCVGAFRHHVKRGRDGEVAKWKGALKQAANITGFKFADSDDEEKLVKKVVEAVLKALPAPVGISPACHPVGLEKTSMDVVNILHSMGDNVGVMGICGMGGIGKTTLAREVYNQEQGRFEHRCFLKDVKDTKGADFMALRMEMARNLFGEDVTKMVVKHARLLEMIQKKRILLVVDDISEAKQFYELIPDVQKLAPGSRVIITSRGSDILKSIMANVPEPGSALYFVQELNPSDSLGLFIKCAFKKTKLDEVDAVFHDNVKKITEACGGVPLALEVIGGYLFHKRNEPKCWREALSVLRNSPDIITRLKISYDGLGSEDEKRMFLDISCFMLGYSKDIALEVWNSIYCDNRSWYLLERLVDKSLVKVDAMGLLQMHDLLRDMGRKIVMDRARDKPEMQSHICDPSLATKVLQRGHSSKEILAISLSGGGSPSMVCKAELFANVKELRYLMLDGCQVNGDFSGWSEELRWLQWRYFPYEELPRDLKLEYLAVLDLANSLHLIRPWSREFEAEFPWKELRALILSNCTKLVELPQAINKLVKLKFLNLEGCVSLRSLPDSLRNLTELEHLNLSRCIQLIELPNLSCFGNLLKLDLGGCKSLTKLPESISAMSSLEVLELSECLELESLPCSVHGLKKLRVLNMQNTAVQELPDDFWQLCSLERVDLSKCKWLVQLPDSFGSLSNLEELMLNGCEHLRKLPHTFLQLTNLRMISMQDACFEELLENFGQLCSLKAVDLSGCKRLMQLPESFGNLSYLEWLNLDGFECLQKLPTTFSKLAKLRWFFMRDAALIELPEDFGQLCILEVVDFSGCKRLMQLPESFGNLSNLEELRLDECEYLQKLPTTFSKLTTLKGLYMRNAALVELPEEFGHLYRLEIVDFSGCKRLMQLPESFGNLSYLEWLNLDGFECLQKLPTTFSKLAKLRWFFMRDAALIELPEDFGQLCILEVVDFSGCKRLMQLPESFGNLSNLEELRLDECEYLQKLPTTFSKLTTLKGLYMRNAALVELPEEFGHLCRLEIVDFSGCKRLMQLPESFGNLSNLERLLLSKCELLQKLPATFSKLAKLKALFMNYSDLVELLEDFEQLCSLEVVHFSGCMKLVQLPESFGKLSNLVEFMLGGCKLPKKLPTAFTELRKLKRLFIRDEGLEELPEDFGQLCSLETVDFSGCRRLVQLPESFGNLSNLERLTLKTCIVLHKLPTTFSKLTKLKELVMEDAALELLPENIGQLSLLEKVDFSFCKSLVELPESFGNLSHLVELRMIGCELLQRLPSSFSKLTTLKVLVLEDTSLGDLPEEFGSLCMLEEAYFSFCKRLTRLPGSFVDLSKLLTLHLDGSEVLHLLPSSICLLKNLREISLSYGTFEDLPEEFGQLQSLTRADFEDCKVLHSLCESFGCLGKLEKVNLSGCSSLIELSRSFWNLTKLEKLDVRGCRLLKVYPCSSARLHVEVDGTKGM